MRSQLPGPRVLVGVALMMVATALGAFTLHRATHRASVWQVSHPLAAGTVLTGADVHLSEVALDDEGAGAYVSTGRRVVGLSLVRDLAAGELLPGAALLDARPTASLVTVPVEPLHLPQDLRRGQRVDVWLSIRDAEQRVTTSERVLARALVESAPGVDASGRSGVVLAVPRTAVASLVTALRAGEIDLVGVPQ